MNRFQRLRINLYHNKDEKLLKSYFGMFDMYEKEKKVFSQSLKFLKAHKDYKNRIQYAFYGHKALVELFNIYHKNINLSDKDLETINLTIDELSIWFKHTMSGHYESTHVHLRILMEKFIEFVFNYLFNENDKEEYKSKNGNKRFNTKDKIKLCIKKADFYKQDVDLQIVKIPNSVFFDLDEYYKIYSDLSKVVHNWIHNKELEFNEEKISETLLKIVSLLEISWSFIYLCLWEKIKEYRNNHFEDAEDIPPTYAKAIRGLFLV